MSEQIFLNLSNHPSAGWSAEQRTAAEALAPVLVDHPFPSVPPEADEGAVTELAAKTLTDLAARVDLAVVAAAMVAGEPTLCVHLVAGLQEWGVPCVAATTERRTVVGADGVKVSVFGFRRFRGWARMRVG